MRLVTCLLAATAATVLANPTFAQGPPPAPVEVVNESLAVEVVNPAPTSLTVQWQLVGSIEASGRRGEAAPLLSETR